MNTPTFEQEKALKAVLENKFKFNITDTSILDLIDEHKITITFIAQGVLAHNHNKSIIGETSRIAILKFLQAL